jgi:NAD+ kinase
MEFQSLNELTIMRSYENMSQIEIFINNVLLTVLQGDGLLISTPTGSTAYNLSCGGSIVHYSAQVICVTPIAPHSLSFRPLILPANVDIKIRIPSTARSSTKVTIDGHTKLDLNVEDYLVIKRSPFSVPFVRWSTENQD